MLPFLQFVQTRDKYGLRSQFVVISVLSVILVFFVLFAIF